MELVGNVKCYEWGKLGLQSFVAQLAKANSKELEIKADCPYAELWMGDHINGPATIKGDRTSLDEVIRKDPAGMLGMDEGRLPFLLKVLSIRKALSVQVHPDKAEAEKLHHQFPDIYKDSNHKPELAIALTDFQALDFQALCGFRPYPQIASLLAESVELRALLGDDVFQEFQNKTETAVKVAYERLMHSDPTSIDKCIESMVGRLQDAEPSEIQQLFLQLYADFGCDVGVLSIYFLNYLRLAPGQAIYLAANVPHAYLDGDCVECMACSDNVVRAGLTPKFKDVDTLLRLVSYSCSPGESMLFQPKLLQPSVQPYTRTFIPPVKDFAVAEIRLPTNVREYTVSNPMNGSILLIVGGKGVLEVSGAKTELKFGKVVFLPSSAGRLVQLNLDETDEPFLAFQAMHNDFE
ncbi:LOW QUALITY PROTEIN: mannose-6-phosphate isomerase [Anopheles nili]|uniref:LOW QUALITY PROTEIN: mannose-6-phosphate isomerase n=1 Tax=Anopheles nili TaxID=185578 RepID=UPI00237B579F|nr:LOW QUALITY PROTEIN: mannose-6-phosphate isomerase [Anopheles nili]